MDENQKRTGNREEENLNYLPFNIQWLDSSYQQTCLPDSPWQKVEETRLLFSRVFLFDSIIDSR